MPISALAQRLMHPHEVSDYTYHAAPQLWVAKIHAVGKLCTTCFLKHIKTTCLEFAMFHPMYHKQAGLDQKFLNYHITRLLNKTGAESAAAVLRGACPCSKMENGHAPL